MPDYYLIGLAIIITLITIIIYSTYLIKKSKRQKEELKKVEAIRERNQKKREEMRYQEQHPLVYSRKARSKNFIQRIAKIRESITYSQKLEYVGAKKILESVQDSVNYVEAKLLDDGFNEFIMANPSKIDQALFLLDSRIKDAEKVCELIAGAIVLQECGNGKEIASVVKEAEQILSNQHKVDSVQYKKEENDKDRLRQKMD